MLRRCLAGLQLPDTVEEIDVTAADVPEHLHDWGSPTILINGVDVGGEQAPMGAVCRLYAAGGDPNSRGVPSEALIRAAIERAKAVRPSL